MSQETFPIYFNRNTTSTEYAGHDKYKNNSIESFVALIISDPTFLFAVSFTPFFGK